MKILQVVSSFPPAYAYGGPAKMVYDISKELIKKGHQVTVYTTDVYDADSRFRYDKNPILMDGIKVYHFKNISNWLAHRNLAIAPTMIYGLKNDILNYDIIHLHEYRTFQSILVHYYARKYNIPYILQPRGTIPTITKNKQKKIFDKIFGHNIIKYANKIIASSKIESSQILELFPFTKDKIVNIPNGIDLETYRNLPNKGEFKRKYMINKNKKIILFLSRIHERKGADILIEVFAKLKKDIDAKLVIAGPDEGYLNRLKSIAKKLNVENDVIFPGPLYGNDKLEAYVDADIFTLPSKDGYESFGNVVLEACVCGVPVIVTSNCGVSEWMGGNIFIVNGSDDLNDAIVSILNNEIMNSEECRLFVNREFGWDNIIKKIEQNYACL